MSAPPALAESWGAEELAATLDSVGTGIWAVDLEGRCVFVNQAACRIFGYSREECLGRNLQCKIHRGHCGGWCCPQQECPTQCVLANGSGAWVDDDVFRHRDGTSFPVQYSVQPVTVRGRIGGAVISMTDIASRKRAEGLLRKSDEWLGLAQRAAGVGIFDADLKTGETRVSEGQFLIYGLDPAGKWLSHEEWLKLIHPEDRDRVDRRLGLALSGAQFPGTEFRIVWPDGSIHWLLSQLKVLFDEAGTAMREVGVNVDVTSRVRAETVLSQFFSASPTPMMIWSFDGRIQQANASWGPVLGFTALELEGLPVFDLVHPEDRAAAEAEFEKVLVSGKRMGFECRVRCKDGSYRWLLVNAGVLKDAQVIFATAHDITKRKSAEESLRQSEARFRSAFDNTLFGMAIVGLDGRYLQVNQSLCRMTGFSEQELLQTDFAAITHPDDVREGLEFRHAMMEGVKSGGITTKRYVRKDGEPICVSVHVALVRDALGTPLHFISLVEDITERKRGEEALRESENRFRDLFDHAPVAYHELDMGGVIRRVNRAECALLGYEAAEMLGRPVWEFVVGADREASRKAIRRKLSGEQPLALVQRCYLRRDGGELWTEVHDILVRNAAGETTGIRTALLDITERKRAEEALWESRERLRSITDSAQDAILMMDHRGAISYWNPAAESIFGYRSEEAIGENLHKLLAPERYLEAHRAALPEFSLTGRGNVIGKTVEMAARRKDGREISVELSLSAVSLNGEWQAVGTVRDITERKRAEEALRANEYILSESQSIAHVGSWSWELPVGTGVCAWTPETYRVFGVSPDTFIPTGEAFPSVIHPDDRAAMQAWIAACLAGDEPPDLEFRIASQDEGVRYVLGRGRLERDAENKPIRMTGIAQDITERHRMTEALKLNVEKLARSNEELERFAYVASHDLQEPLRMVASFTQLLAKRYSGRLDETADRYIHYAVDGAKRMQELIADLLAYSRVNNKELDLRQTGCEAVVLEAMRNLDVAIKESGACIDWDPLPSLWVDQGQLTQVFQNLLANAIKFRRKEECPRIHVSAVDSGVEWLISVRDNGIGIDPRHAERVFQMFQRLHTRAEYPGTGIGLAVCKKVIERHGGKLWVESEPGAGSTFRFTIPKPERNAIGGKRANQTSRDSVD
jgi:PAS domain S-box-containing protein